MVTCQDHMIGRSRHHDITKVEAISDNADYAKESEDYLPGLYYLVTWKKYLKEENTWKPTLAI